MESRPLSESGPVQEARDGDPLPDDRRRVAGSLTDRLRELADAGTPRERELLGVVLARAMTPTQRLRYLAGEDTLSDDERELLGSLQIDLDRRA